jgi:hypothetical protein
MSYSTARVLAFKKFTDSIPESPQKSKLLDDIPLGSNFFVVNAGREGGRSVHEVREITTNFHSSNLSLGVHFRVRLLTDDCCLMFSPNQVKAWLELRS